jgi:hypothetical protein
MFTLSPDCGDYMAVLQVNIPDELKAQFEQVFAGQDIDDLINRLMHDALEQSHTSQRERRTKAIEELLSLRSQTLPVSADEIREAREWGRP